MIIDQPLSCTYQAILTDVPLQIWDAKNTYFLSGMSAHLNRIWLNTPAITTLNLAQCSAHYLSPSFFLRIWGMFGLLFWILGLILVLWVYRKQKILTLTGIGIYLAVMIGEVYR